VDIPEAILRLLLAVTEIERVYEPPPGYDPEQQGEWDESLVTFAFKRQFILDTVQRDPESLLAVYKIEGAGYWQVEIGPDRVILERV
jgi:hypothetical protein